MISPTSAEVEYSPYRWPLHILTVSYFLMGFLVRFSWPPLASVAGAELGMDMTQVGSYMSAFYIGYVLIHIPAGVLGDRFGVRGMIVVALAVEGLASLCMTLVDSYGTGFALRLLAGLGAGMAYASCVRCVVRSFPLKEQGLAFGFLLMAPVGGGVICSNLLMPWLSGLWEWRGAFAAVGVTALALSVAAFFLLRDMGSVGEKKDFFSGLRFVLGNRALVMISLAGFCLMWSQISFVTWGNSYLKELGFSLSEAGIIMMAFGVGGSFGPLLAGVICARVRQPKWVMGFAFILAFPLTLAFGGMEGTSGLVLTACLLGVFFGMGNTPINVIMSLFAGKDRSATASGVFGFVAQSGAILGPLIIGYSIDLTQAFSAAWWIMAAACLVGFLLLLPIPMPPENPHGS